MPCLAALGVLTAAPAANAAVTANTDFNGPAGTFQVLVNGDSANDLCTIELEYSAIAGRFNFTVYDGFGPNDPNGNPPGVMRTSNFIIPSNGESFVVDLGTGRDVIVVNKINTGLRPATATTDLHFLAYLGAGGGVWKNGTGGVANPPAGNGVTDLITCSNTEGSYYYGEPGPQGNRNAGDQAYLFDSPGNDGCLSQVNFSYITNGDLSHFRYVESVPVVYIYSQFGGRDYCVHNLNVSGGAPEAYVMSGTAFSYGSGSVVSGGETFTYFTVCAGFPINYGYSIHNDDFAYFIDSPGNDTYFGANNPFATSYMSGPHASGQGYFNAASGFPLCFAQSFVSPADFDTAVIANQFTNVIVGFNSVINQ